MASFTYTCGGRRCTFDGSGSTDDTGVVSYAWRANSPGISNPTGAVVTIDLKRGGTFAVTLTVRDRVGQVNSLTRSITVVK